jgi:hypothetical protein
MRLRNLFEAFGEEVAIIFGRFNPPHKGHRAAWELASKSPIWYVGTNESTVGPKDPLPFDVKVEAMKTVWPKVEGHIVAETSWLTLASKVYEKNPKATLLCLTDEDWVTKTIIQYNGKEGAHGFYNFKKIEQKPTPRLSSATALRDAVSKGDRDAFTQAAGVDADTPVAGKSFFDLVAEYLLPYSNAPKKIAKKKVAEPVESVAEAAGLEKEIVYQGHKIKFTPTQLVILKGGDVVLTRPGDFSNPTKQQLAVAKRFIDQVWQKDKEKQQVPNISQQHDLYGLKKEYENIQKEIQLFLKPYEKERSDLVNATRGDKDAWIQGITLLQGKYLRSPEYKELKARHEDIRKKMNKISKVSSWNKKDVAENFADGKNPGRKGLAKRSGVNTKASVSDLRKTAKNSSGEKQRMAHWMANMKAGKAKNEEAAGVGIITKQNSTVDVNKDTPRKNLKAFKLVK